MLTLVFSVSISGLVSGLFSKLLVLRDLGSNSQINRLLRIGIGLKEILDKKTSSFSSHDAGFVEGDLSNKYTSSNFQIETDINNFNGKFSNLQITVYKQILYRGFTYCSFFLLFVRVKMAAC